MKPNTHQVLKGPLVLVVLDGFGDREDTPDNAVTHAKMPVYHGLLAQFPHTTIGTSGRDVGLPQGQMGNSEVGHLNLGAGRVAMMDISKIDNAVADGTLMDVPELAEAVQIAKGRGGRVHLMGLLSDGGVHSSIEHVLALIQGITNQGLSVVVHPFLDGRDTPPKSAGNYLKRLQDNLPHGSMIGSLCGRFWAMDRDNRWERIELAYRVLAEGQGEPAKDVFVALSDAYQAGKTDEFVMPRVMDGYDGIQPSDIGIFFNFRPDRAREMSLALTAETFPHFIRGVGQGVHRFAHFVCMTEYDASLGLPVAFHKPRVPNTLGEVLAAAGKTQLRCAETEKYAHVTFFFNGGVEKPNPGETRSLIPSPKDVATYDLKPEMSAAGVAASVVKHLHEHRPDFVLVNFANPDMVGHTGVFEAALLALAAVDQALGKIVDETLALEGALLITADHGNCEQMVDPITGAPFTQHTTNRVPFLYVRDDSSARHANKLRSGGRLADVAPTVLELLSLPVPIEMTGESLILPLEAGR